ncbi:TIGR03503 family protein [Vibrio sp. SCSIO 43136]|uniref:TIGR03503 family protein n=1 Tax=Vibrio sp. SCSIO 43136 TaxID=2819101 RepID=UPI002075A2E3|nr:TIGR03503 family protein [Vibrio sp. SCSIO 43136]USD65929.1 TIGR03503 family protein [Vibrio sp. SCSIO 43136]
MLRILLGFFCLMLSFVGRAETESAITLLDNRFRVDSTISQVSFLIYRKERSQSVILVRPDGVKYYAWNHPEHVRWYNESGMDIISIDNPMPGPWQAIGKVHPANNIRIISNLQLEVDLFPQRLYLGETLKFTARLEQNGDPLNIRDFLDRVELTVTFTKYIENEEALSPDARPIPTVIGRFLDDGTLLDEKPGDGVFTAQLPIDIEPGKYRARISSGNGVFLRAIEQTVLVYPRPFALTFNQARVETVDHTLDITPEKGSIATGSLALTVTQTTPAGLEVVTQDMAAKDADMLKASLPNSEQTGRHAWEGHVYATEAATGRELMFKLPEQTFGVVEKVDVEKSMMEFKKAQEEQKRLEDELKRAEEREAAKTKGIIIIAVGNVVILILGVLGWFIWRKIKLQRADIPEMQLSMPPKD